MASDQHHVVFHDDKTTGGAEWQAKVDEEIASRPVARPVPEPSTAYGLNLHTQLGVARRNMAAATVAYVRENYRREVVALEKLIAEEEKERRR